MVRWLRWHCPPDTGFEIRTLAVWGRARYLSVTEAPRNTDFHTWMGKKHFCFFQTAESGNRTPISGVKGSGANHYPRAPAHFDLEHVKKLISRLNVGLRLNQCLRLWPNIWALCHEYCVTVGLSYYMGIQNQTPFADQSILLDRIQQYRLLTLSSLNLQLSSHSLQAVNCYRNSRLVVNEDDLKWVENWIKLQCIGKSVAREFSS